MKKTLPLLLLFFSLTVFAQTNIISTSVTAEKVMLGNYDPLDFGAGIVIDHPDTISKLINKWVSPDSLKSYIEKLGTFYNRNSGSDTLSSTKGIGAARGWVFDKFKEFSGNADKRLIPSFLQWDEDICNVGTHKNMFSVLPGSDITDPSIIIVEAHIDSRCEGLCDIDCQAMGMEDNASGSALVLELARVMSQFTFKNTIVFMLTIAEEQGLLGANAFATYCQEKGIKIKCVLNNDVVGGVVCGKTASPPGCAGEGLVDSTHVRLFSYGSVNSFHKQFARFTKLEYQEQLINQVTVPMGIRIMSPEDRTGRGGDHIPFRQKGYTSIRLTCQNEHGDADVSDPNYMDRQHSFRDVLGVDTNNDGIIDSFFVNFNYLARNTVINANSLAMAAQGLITPGFDVTSAVKYNIDVEIKPIISYPAYRVALRSISNDWDTVYTTSNLFETYVSSKAFAGKVYVSVASVNELGIESLFSEEKTVDVTATDEVNEPDFELLQNRPNPFDEATYILFISRKSYPDKNASVVIRSLDGKELERIPVKIKEGMNEVLYHHEYHAVGTLVYSLEVNGVNIDSKRMVFAN